MIIVLFGFLILMLIISAIVSAIETAITGTDFIKVETIADKGNRKAKKALDFQGKQQHIISTMLFLNNVVNIVATTITTILVTIYIKNIPLAVATAILTFVILIFCEITPKRIANKDAEEILIFYVDLIGVILKIFYPVVFFLSVLSDGIAKILGVNLKEEEDRYTEEEIKTLLDVSQEQGVLERAEKEIMERALEFGDKTLKEIMIPNENVIFINIKDTYDEVINTFLNYEYTRFPVIDDNIDNVVGVLNIKDFVKLQKIGKEKYDLKELMREPYFLNENVKITSAFKRMQKLRTSIVIVRSNNCKTDGIATMEDILEEIVGEINDEYDE